MNHPMDTIKLKIQTDCEDSDEIKELQSRDSKDSFSYFNENDLIHDGNNNNNKNDNTGMFYDDKYDKYSNNNSKKKQKINHNLISMGLLMIKKDGFWALFAGIEASTYSTIFSSAFFCIIYEMIKRESTMW